MNFQIFFFSVRCLDILSLYEYGTYYTQRIRLRFLIIDLTSVFVPPIRYNLSSLFPLFLSPLSNLWTVATVCCANRGKTPKI